MPLSGHLAALLGITATVRDRFDGLKVSQQAAGESEVMLYGAIVPGIQKERSSVSLCGRRSGCISPHVSRGVEQGRWAT